MSAMPRSPSNPRIISDAQLKTDAISELRWDPRVTIADLRLGVCKGVITLKGEVSNLPERLIAGLIVRELPSVQEVINEIQVKIPLNEKQSDAEIRKAITLIMLWNHQVPRDLGFIVKDAWVSLTGNVSWQFQRKAAFHAISAIHGIQGITNAININPATRAKEIKQRIEKAIQRISGDESKTIQIHVEENLVTLTGYVKSFADIERARNAAWSAPGILAVENRLQFAS